ncbi:McrC family protein [Hydrogenimonas urashimensis]|uniref:McrC family protein n=1 Tax=Hydrogenimonas urashimensis TaxID=2740515 RepID=UPI0019162780|nr:restriction endonuclease [Hydrogenimonas urashimensis]
MEYLTENRPVPKELAETIRRTPALQPYFKNSFAGVVPDNYCGFLQLEGKSYFIVPKIADEATDNLDIFITMLLYAQGVDLRNEDLFEAQNQKHDILELFIRLFATGLFEELKRGVFRSYVTKREDLKVLRGKYLFEKNFRHFHHQNLHCEYDEFSMDNPLNRFFLYAIDIFRRFSHDATLRRCEAIFDEVTRQRIDHRRHAVRFDRLNRRFEKSYTIAKMILDRLVPLPSTKEERSFAFLFDMGEVFEAFVGRLVQEIDSTARLQVQRNFGNLQLKPDILTDRLIIDTKYKSIANRDDLATQDKYQMFAYGINFGIKDVMLLYPKHRVDVREDLVLGEGENVVRLRMRSLELGYASNEFMKNIKNNLKDMLDEK